MFFIVLEVTAECRSIWVLPKCFYWILWIQWQKIVFKKIFRTRQLLCKRPGCYHSASKTEVAERIFKLSPIHASVPKFAEVLFTLLHNHGWIQLSVLPLQFLWRSLPVPVACTRSEQTPPDSHEPSPAAEESWWTGGCPPWLLWICYIKKSCLGITAY